MSGKTKRDLLRDIARDLMALENIKATVELDIQATLQRAQEKGFNPVALRRAVSFVYEQQHKSHVETYLKALGVGSRLP